MSRPGAAGKSGGARGDARRFTGTRWTLEHAAILLRDWRVRRHTGCRDAATAPAGKRDGKPERTTEASTPPNIIVIVTDDLDARSVACMPNVQTLLAAEGVTFANAFVTTPLCCPSRASILRGQYAHSHGVLSNVGDNGGFPAFYRLGDEDSTVATWLQDAGYRTALVGKYLNRYPKGAAESHVPPGWDEWSAFASSDEDEGGSYYSGYALNEDGTIVFYGQQPSEYSTDVLAAKATDFVARAAATGDPFFLYIAPFAPHGPSTPASRHTGAFAGVQAPRVPSFDEADVTDKPAWVQALPSLDDDQIALLDDRYRRRLRSLLAVDEMVASLVETLERRGRPGQHLHRVHVGQRLPPRRARNPARQAVSVRRVDSAFP